MMNTDPPSTDLRAGLERVALDLHVHTPASQDWQGKEESAEQIVARAVERGLDGIAVTDHQSGQFVDELRSAAAGTALTVIPGIEITNLAGSEGIHLIALFDLETTAENIDHFLVSIDALTGSGANVKRGTAKKGILEVLAEIQKRNGIAVMAHCQSSKGSLAEMRGDVRTELVRHPVVLAAEASAEEFFDEKKKAERRRTYDLLDGSDPVYQRKLAVYQASDNPAGDGYGHGHGLAGIGSRFTYFYVERPITLESLRQCFIDREVRIEYPQVGAAVTPPSAVAMPRLVRVEIDDGFLEDLKLDLHPGLTTILGSKGSGKSVLIEVIRFALNQAPEQADIRDDHETKLKKRLGLYGKVTAIIEDSGGTLHEIARTYDPARDNPYDRSVTFDPAEFFPCHFLSQNEIIRLAESEDEQIKFIDSFFDFHTFQRDIEAARADLVRLDKSVAQQIRAQKRITELEADLKRLSEQIDEKDKALVSPVFSKFRAAESKRQALDRSIGTIDAVISAAVAGHEELLASPDFEEPPGPLNSDQLLRQVGEKISAARSKALEASASTLDLLQGARNEVVTTADDWKPTFESINREYVDEIKKMGGDAPALSQERARLDAARAEIEKDLLGLRQQADRLRPTADQRRETLDKLEQRQADHTAARQKRCSWFEDKSEGQIQARVDARSNFDEFAARLGAMKKGSYLTAADVNAIAGSVPPRSFVSAILNYDQTRNDEKLVGLHETSGLPIEKLRVLADFLLGEQSYEDLLALAYTATPTDRPEIRFRRVDGSYAPLDELSTGQKATAFLVMTLCEGEKPIIVDQPEDSLDIRSIWDDMCVRLRRSKRARQFIFTTHNSSLAVASDSDKFAVLVGDARHSKLVMSGAIDTQSMRSHLLQLLEGGKDTYFLKQRKYDVTDESHD